MSSSGIRSINQFVPAEKAPETKKQQDQKAGPTAVSSSALPVISHTNPELKPEQAESKARELARSLSSSDEKAMGAIGGLDEAAVRALLED